MEKELDPKYMAQIRSLVENVCEDFFHEIDMEFVKKAGDYTIKRMAKVVLGWESDSFKLIELKRIVGK